LRLIKQNFYSIYCATRADPIRCYSRSNAVHRGIVSQYFSADSHSRDFFIERQKFNGAVKPSGARRNQIKLFLKRENKKERSVSDVCLT